MYVKLVAAALIIGVPAAGEDGYDRRPADVAVAAAKDAPDTITGTLASVLLVKGTLTPVE